MPLRRCRTSGAAKRQPAPEWPTTQDSPHAHGPGTASATASQRNWRSEVPEEPLLPSVPLTVAAVALGLAIQVRDGEYAPVALGLLTMAIVTLGVTLARAFPTPLVLFRRGGESLQARSFSAPLPALLLCGGLAIQFALLATSWPGTDLPHRGGLQLLPFRLGLALAVLLVIAGVGGTRAFAAVWFPGLLAVSLLLGFWMIHASPRPHIDVWMFQQDGARELLRGSNPYAMTFPDIYHSTLPGHAAAYGNGLVVNDRLQFGFVYPPLSLLLSTMGYVVAGDYRYAMAVALVLAAAVIGYAEGGYADSAGFAGRGSKLTAALLLFTPRVFFVLARGWTEPFVLLLLAATVFIARQRMTREPAAGETVDPRVPLKKWTSRHSALLLAVALGLLVAVKQYAIIALPISFLLLPPGWRWRDWFYLAGQAVAVAAAITVPFALWNLQAFWKSVVSVQLAGPFRWDALSYQVWWGFHGHGATPPSTAFLCSLIALAAALGLCVWRAPRNPAGFSASFAFVLLLFLAFNKQAFANYYFSVIGALCCAIAAGGTEAQATLAARHHARVD